MNAHVPNLLTIARVFLTVIFLVLMNQGGVGFKVAGLLVFIGATLTDYFDGAIARKHQLVSEFGKIADPISDKFLTLSSFYLFSHLGVIPFWMFVVLAVREIFVTVHRLWIIRHGKVVAAEQVGKIKTVLQMVAIYVILLFIIFDALSFTDHVKGVLLPLWQWIIAVLMWGVVLLTVYSGVLYAKQNLACLKK